jgi:STE24 endopeptidase
MRRFLIGLAGGFVLGYVGFRAVQTLADLRNPFPPLSADPKTYGRLRRRLMLCGIVRSLAELGAAAYGPGVALAPRDGGPEARPRRIALLGGALLLSSLLELSVAYMEGHVLERRYGLSKQDARAWGIDQAKALGLSLAIALPLLESLASVIERAPRSWPWLVTAGTMPLLIVANVIAPNLIAPLFNTFEPIDGSLERRLRQLASRYDAGDATILRVDMSRQTEKANAYVTGLFGSKRIVIGDTLLVHFEEPEIAFVVAHELGHFVSGDVWRSVAAGIGAAALVFFGASAIADRRQQSLASAAGLGRIFFAASFIALAVGPAMAYFSRARERAADRFALESTHDPQSGIDAFRRLRDRNLAEEEPPLWMEVLFASHPSLRRRIETLERSKG